MDSVSAFEAGGSNPPVRFTQVGSRCIHRRKPFCTKTENLLTKTENQKKKLSSSLRARDEICTLFFNVCAH